MLAEDAEALESPRRSAAENVAKASKAGVDFSLVKGVGLSRRCWTRRLLDEQLAAIGPVADDDKDPLGLRRGYTWAVHFAERTS